LFPSTALHHRNSTVCHFIQELRYILNDNVSAPNSISVKTPETTSTTTCGENYFLSLRFLIYAYQEEHHQIAYYKTMDSKGKKQSKTRPFTLYLK
jgi:hypothetical protein